MQYTEPPEKYYCSVCDEETSSKCIGCYSSPYCTTECFETDYLLHKLLCLQYQGARAQGSSDAVTRAILFPDTCDKPRFDWVSTEWITKGYLKNTADGPLGEGEIEMIQIRCTYRSGKPMRIYRLKDSRNCANNSIMRVTGGQASHVWTGRVLAVVEPALSLELDMPGFRILCDFLRSYTPLRNQYLASAASFKKIKAVRINGEGFRSRFESPNRPFRPVSILPAHPVFSAKECCDLPAMAGIALYIHRYDIKFYPGEFENKLASKITRCGDITSKEWGQTRWPWKGVRNAALIVRQDGKDLLPQHVEALCAWCQNYLEKVISSDAVKDANTEESGGHENAKRVIEQAARESFENHWMSFSEKKAFIDENWKNVPSPYEIEDIQVATAEVTRIPLDESHATLKDEAYATAENEVNAIVQDEASAAVKAQVKNEANGVVKDGINKEANATAQDEVGAVFKNVSGTEPTKDSRTKLRQWSRMEAK